MVPAALQHVAPGVKQPKPRRHRRPRRSFLGDRWCGNSLWSHWLCRSLRGQCTGKGWHTGELMVLRAGGWGFEALGFYPNDGFEGGISHWRQQTAGHAAAVGANFEM